MVAISAARARVSGTASNTASFNAVMDAFRLPKGSADEAAARDRAVAEATRGATRVPLAVLEAVPETLALAAEIATIGNAPSLSDAGVAVLTALAGAEGAYDNVIINLQSLKDLDQAEAPDFLPASREAAGRALARCRDLAAAARQDIRGRLESALDA
ncbi:MAG: cyclodeaminase/cyclohydrolase family protein [Candidatus Krumholzibacteriia bacterium]